MPHITVGENIAQLLDLASAPVLLTLLIAALLTGVSVPLYRSYRDRAQKMAEPEPETLSGLRVLAWILALVGIPLFAFILTAVIAIIATFDPVSLGKELRWHVLAFVGLITSLGALISAPLALIRVWTTERQTRISEQGHMTDRISKAVEHLGAEKTVKRDGVEESRPNIEVRIGGLLSLERIAQDSTAYDKGRDHVRVMEIICAYVRENAPARDAHDFPEPDWKPLKDDATEEERTAHLEAREIRFGGTVKNFFAKASIWAQTLPKPREDIALAVHIIGRRTPVQKRIEARWGPKAAADAECVFDTPCPELPELTEEEAPLGNTVIHAFNTDLTTWKKALATFKGYRPDLTNTSLQRLDLSSHDLSGCLLARARLEGADLKETRLQGANLQEALLDAADLTGARLEAADLRQTRLEAAYLAKARMQGADLEKARLDGASLLAALLQGADLTSARLEAACLVGTRLEGADLSGARLQGASHTGARLEGAVLKEVRLEGASFTGACLERADLRGARLEGASFINVDSIQGAALKQMSLFKGSLSEKQVTTTFGDASVTNLPGNMPRPAHWPSNELDKYDFYNEWAKWLADPDNYTPPMG
ncbi:uncharacterized protein YjbI with pentapeptide repeats [Sagittula marina]|uniref:Uncharacterized protein YjbI with pentapeptide repeats n=1 Tax=Sagittula marina TaxID=943940 RepID=A0A7W6DS48_9RHOB|nr:uncharacterized protein YjbI with pentapeptide repeats [Sagittula marina]